MNLQRPYFKPQTQERDGEVVASKFSGMPYLAPGESWPVCGHCKQPMQLFLQLDNSTLPAPAKGMWDGLLQLFYCTNDEGPCECQMEAWSAFTDGKPPSSTLVRAIVPSSTSFTPESSLVNDAFPPRLIVGWEEGMDEPNEDEISDITGEDVLYPEEEGRTASGDKLLGWPYWIQGVEYPNCPQCNTPMRMVFQIDSEDNLPYMFGDSGIGHLTQCALHRDVFGFGWACC